MANLRVNDPEIFLKFSSVALPLIETQFESFLARGPNADRHEGTEINQIKCSKAYRIQNQ